MKAQHDNLQPVAAVGAFEEAWLDEVVGAAGGEVDAPVGQAVAVQETNVREVKKKPLSHQQWVCILLLQQLGDAVKTGGICVFSNANKLSGFALELCKHFLPPCASLPTILVSTPGDSCSKETSSALEIPREPESEAYLNICYSEVAAKRSLERWLQSPSFSGTLIPALQSTLTNMDNNQTLLGITGICSAFKLNTVKRLKSTFLCTAIV